MDLTVGSLFSGIGGFDLGLERIGIAPVWQVEKSDSCNKVLEKHWPEVSRFKDVTEFKKSVASISPGIICGGFPCQDVSVAGRRKGLAGERSGLWFEFARIIAEFQPRWLLIENVTGLLSSHEGQDFAVIIKTLCEFGYGVGWRVLDSQYFGVAQRRRRVFIVGHLGDAAGPLEILFESESMSGNSPPSRETESKIADTLTSGVAASRGVNAPGRRREDDVNIVSALDTRPYADHEAKESRLVVSATLNSGGNSGGFRTEPGEHLVHCEDKSRSLTVCKTSTGRLDPNEMEFVAYQCQGSNVGPMGTLRRGNGVDGTAVRRLTPRECERLQGFPDDWTRWDKDGNELSDSARYRMIGNAVTVNVAEWIGKRFVNVIEQLGK